MAWTEVDKAIVKSRIESGEHPSTIAPDFRTTRNAILGLMRRNGWASPHNPVATRAAAQRRKRSKPLPHKPNAQVIRRMRVNRPNCMNEVKSSEVEVMFSTAEFDDQIPVEQRKQFIKLKDRDCKWPCGDPRDQDFFFCGAVALDDKPYCAFHHRASVQPSGGGQFALRRWATKAGPNL